MTVDAPEDWFLFFGPDFHVIFGVGEMTLFVRGTNDGAVNNIANTGRYGETVLVVSIGRDSNSSIAIRAEDSMSRPTELTICANIVQKRRESDNSKKGPHCCTIVGMLAWARGSFIKGLY